ncbi:MAG: hypothetical protein JW814_09280 [Candidatus Krumholzibacteriota bacterium]|nr:hypothetical protein [Candidatus Krumholzibacteriota bacterium]
MKSLILRIAIAIVLLMPPGLHLISCSSATGTDDEGIAPGAITDLAVVSITDTTATLTWTATGDDDNEGTAALNVQIPALVAQGVSVQY